MLIQDKASRTNLQNILKSVDKWIAGINVLQACSCDYYPDIFFISIYNMMSLMIALYILITLQVQCDFVINNPCVSKSLKIIPNNITKYTLSMNDFR